MTLGSRRPVPGKLGKAPKEEAVDKPRPRRAGKLGKTKDRPGVASEKRNALKLGARLQPGSGNYVGKKGDFVGKGPESFMGENKATKHASFPLKFSVLRKIWREANRVRRQPLLVVDFEAVEGAAPNVWVCLPIDLFRRMVDTAGWDWNEEA